MKLYIIQDIIHIVIKSHNNFLCYTQVFRTNVISKFSAISLYSNGDEIVLMLCIHE